MHSPKFGENQARHQHKHLVPTVKHSGGGVRIWALMLQSPDLGTLQIVCKVTMMQARPQIDNTVAEKEKNYCVAMPQWCDLKKVLQN